MQELNNEWCINPGKKLFGYSDKFYLYQKFTFPVIRLGLKGPTSW